MSIERPVSDDASILNAVSAARLLFLRFFFQKALEESILEIDECGDPDTQKTYSLFFLDIINLQLGDQYAFDFLIEKYQKVMPLDLNMAIYCESKIIKERSTIIRKQNRKIRGMLVGNKSLQHSIDVLFDKPIIKQ